MLIVAYRFVCLHICSILINCVRSLDIFRYPEDLGNEPNSGADPWHTTKINKR